MQDSPEQTTPWTATMMMSVRVENRNIPVTPDGLLSLRVPQLRSIAASLGLRISGRKAEIVERILTVASENPQEFSLQVPTCFGEQRKKKTGTGLSFPFGPCREPRSPFIDCLCGGAPSKWPGVPLCCSQCSLHFHTECMRWSDVAEGDIPFLCPRCRIAQADSFNPLSRLVWFNYVHGGSKGTRRQDFSHHPHVSLIDVKFGDVLDNLGVEWDRNSHEVFAFGLRLYRPQKLEQLFHMEWPYTIDFTINGNVESVVLPRSDHKRRDGPVQLGHLLRGKQNSGSVTASVNSVASEDYSGPYAVAIGICQRMSPSDSEQMALSRPEAAFSACESRVIQLLRDCVDDDEVQFMRTGTTVKLACPISLLRMDRPARGIHCRHLQCFDLTSYLQVNKQMKTFNSRWKCPECSLLVRPENLVFDSFMARIMSLEPNSAVVDIERDATWKARQPVKGEVSASDGENDEEEQQSNTVAELWEKPREVQDLTRSDEESSDGVVDIPTPSVARPLVCSPQELLVSGLTNPPSMLSLPTDISSLPGPDVVTGLPPDVQGPFTEGTPYSSLPTLGLNNPPPSPHHPPQHSPQVTNVFALLPSTFAGEQQHFHSNSTTAMYPNPLAPVLPVTLLTPMGSRSVSQFGQQPQQQPPLFQDSYVYYRQQEPAHLWLNHHNLRGLSYESPMSQSVVDLTLSEDEQQLPPAKRHKTTNSNQ